MANTAQNVSVGKPKVSGGIYRAPLGTTLPTDATTALSDAFVSLGYIAQDGVTNNNTIESEDYRAWGGDVVLSYQTEKTDTFAFGLIEVLNKTTYETIAGASNVSGTLTIGIAVSVNAKDLDEYVYVIELALRGGASKRIVIPDGKITELGEVVYADEEAINYPVTVTAQADASGNTHYEYIVKAATT